MIDIANLVNPMLNDQAGALLDEIGGEIVVVIGDVSIAYPDQRVPRAMVVNGKLEGRSINSVSAVSWRNSRHHVAALSQNPDIWVMARLRVVAVSNDCATRSRTDDLP